MAMVPEYQTHIFIDRMITEIVGSLFAFNMHVNLFSLHLSVAVRIQEARPRNLSEFPEASQFQKLIPNLKKAKGGEVAYVMTALANVQLYKCLPHGDTLPPVEKVGAL